MLPRISRPAHHLRGPHFILLGLLTLLRCNRPSRQPPVLLLFAGAVKDLSPPVRLAIGPSQLLQELGYPEDEEGAIFFEKVWADC